MTEQTFYHAVNKITEFLGAKDVPLHVKAAWIEKIKHIPDECAPYIVAKITDESDAMPRNLPKVFRERFLQWQSENPKKMTQERSGCQDCEDGVLFLEREGVTATVFCSCHQGSSGKMGRASLRDMEARGWRSTKAKTIGPGFNGTAGVRTQVANARKQWDRPDPERRDYYEEAEEDSAW